MAGRAAAARAFACGCLELAVSWRVWGREIRKKIARPKVRFVRGGGHACKRQATVSEILPIYLSQRLSAGERSTTINALESAARDCGSTCKDLLCGA
jgi:hypothetical protein